MDLVNQRKWDSAARAYDFMNSFGTERRWAPFKRKLFGLMQGKVLFVAIGTGLDIQFFPPGQDIVALDISPGMLKKARVRSGVYSGSLTLRLADVHDATEWVERFDQVFTSCTFCSVPNPIEGLKSLRRILTPGGELHMFEHTASRYYPFRTMLDLMSPLVRQVGPELNRETVENVKRAGFDVKAVDYVYLEVVKMIHAVPSPSLTD